MTSGPAMSRYCVTCHPAATTQAREESIDVELDWPSAEEMEEARRTAERQQRWRAESVEKQQAARAARARELADGAQTIERALDAYKDLPDLAPTVRIRTDFVALRSARPLSPALGGPEPGEALDGWEFRREDRRTRPPMSKLLIRRTHALPSYLAMLYVAHTEASIVQAGRRNRHANASRVNGQESWAVLCGRWAPTTRARRARMVRDLDELLGADLVSIGPHGKQGRYEGFGMLSDDTTDRDYRLPSPTLDWPDVISLPASFFLRGWHLVLTPAEIAILLMARRATLAIPDTSDEPGVGIPQSIRWSRYGISGEAY